LIGHSRKSYTAYTLHCSMCYRCRVIGDVIFTLRESGFVLACMFLLREYGMVVDLFCTRDFDLDLMTFIYQLDGRYIGRANMNFLHRGFQKLSSDRIDQNYKPITRHMFCGTWYLPHSHVHN